MTRPATINPSQTDTEAPKRVAIAMSGGVDSSAAAALLVEQGHEVVGVHMKLHDLPEQEKHSKACCSLDDTLDARQACARLGIPFYVVDLSQEFEREVIQYFVESYRAGVTPNPCAKCNVAIKSKLLLEKVREFGCDYLATGHYARVEQNSETGVYQLMRPADRHRDQTYFLFGTKAEELPALMFPLADYLKPAARELAKSRDFLTWDKPDSQEVCFVPKDYRQFLRKRFGEEAPQPGDFVDTNGRVLGRHQGLPYYTIGQRRGLGLSAPEPLYVLSFDMEHNAVVVGPEADLDANEMIVTNANWVSCPPPIEPLEALVKVRYAHQGTRATIEPLADNRLRVVFQEPVRAITPGQAAAFYDGEVLLGGGWIILDKSGG